MALPAPDQVAESFCATLASAFAQGGAGLGTLGSLYSDASAIALDGNAYTTLPAIADLYRQRLASGPVKVRFLARPGAQWSPARQLLLLATGESSFPPGRFSTVFVLESTPSGGMYIRAEVLRFSAGARPFFTDLDASKAGERFASAYYAACDGARSTLTSHYREVSQLTFEGQAATGLAQIAERLTKMPSGKTTPATLDVVPIGSTSLLVLVTGAVVIAGEANPIQFVQAFNLMPEAGGALFIANEFFQFQYG